MLISYFQLKKGQLSIDMINKFENINQSRIISNLEYIQIHFYANYVYYFSFPTINLNFYQKRNHYSCFFDFFPSYDKLFILVRNDGSNYTKDEDFTK